MRMRRMVRLSFVQPLRRFAPAPLVGEPLAKRTGLRVKAKLSGMPRPPLVRSNNDDRRQRRKQGVAVGAAASRMRGPHQGPKQMLGAATRAAARRRRDGEV